MIATAKSEQRLWPLGLAVALSLFGDLTLYAVLVTQLDVVGISLGAAGVMLGINRLIRIPGNPLGGLLLDRWGRRRLFILGMSLGVLSTAGYAFLRGFWPFLLARLVWGMAWILINVGGMTIALDLSTSANRGRLLGVYNTWALAGFAVAPLVGGFLVDTVGFRTAMLACAGITGLGLIVAWLALPETAPPTTPVADRPGRRDAHWWRQWAQDLVRRINALVRGNQGLTTAAFLYMITVFVGDGVILSTLSLLLQQRMGLPVAAGGVVLGVAAAAGLLLGLRALLAGIAGPIAGHLSDIWRARWPVIAVSLVVGVAGLGLLAYAQALSLIVVGVALAAVSGGAALASLTALVGDLAPAGRQGMAMGALATAGDVGSTAGPFLAFAIAAIGDVRWVYLVSALALLAGLLLVWRNQEGLVSVSS